MTRRAIVLVPGFCRDERFFRRDVLVRNLLTVEGSQLQPGAALELNGERGLGLRQRGMQPEAPDHLVVFEAYWADMVGPTTATGPWQKLWQGFDLVQYWVLSGGMWSALRVARFAALGLMASGILLVLWYLSLALLVANALANDPTLTEQVIELPILGGLMAGMLDAARALGSWKFWALVAFVLGLVDVDSLVAKASFTKSYFENTPDDTEVGLRDRIRSRVYATVSTVLGEDFDEVVVVGHGFGAVIAVDILCGIPLREDWGRMTLVTLGAPLGVLRLRSRWLSRELDSLIRADKLPRWIDFYSSSDWLSLPVPGHGEQFEKGASRMVELEASLGDRLTSKTHLAYYRHQPVLELLAAPMPEPPVEATQVVNEFAELAPSA